MKEAEQYLKDAFVSGEWDELMKYLNTDLTPSILKAMKEYALQEVKKHLKIASERAIFKYSGMQDSGNLVVRPFIDKESITNIKIELT